MSDVRAIEPRDARMLDALLDSLDLAAARGAIAHEILTRRALGLFTNGVLEGVVAVSPVPFSIGAYEIHFIALREGEDALPKLQRLLAAVRDDLARSGAANVRFIGGRLHRAGIEPHLLDAAGLDRRGRIASFYGPEDDLLVYAMPIAARGGIEFDPTSPAHLYDAAFGYRDFIAERDFLLACARAHGTLPVRRVASWACASGRHLQAFADIAIDGVGIDEDVDQLELAARLFNASGSRASIEWSASPLDAPIATEPVDLSFTMLSVVHRLATEAALIGHLQSAASILAPGGVHVIEATHPSDLDPERAKIVAWTELRGRYAVQSRFRLDIERRARDATVPALLDVRCRDQETGVIAGTLQQQERWLVPDEAGWARIVERAGGFEIATILGDFQLGVASNQPGAWRTLLVMRRTG